ncbi:hypothetical protein C9J47_19470 [Photobacterium indicum]|uniref:Uncharacterized protein n=2 Tax=Photobacterium indicum TaxID=81447 RepID=A0A2T3L589_9GAMM|nr:hypothetical protein C9J47_19470 [Photobacterium indicum]
MLTAINNPLSTYSGQLGQTMKEHVVKYPLSILLLYATYSIAAMDKLDSFDTAIINKTLTKVEIQSIVNHWYSSELGKVEQTANRVSNHIPLNERTKLVKVALDEHYQTLCDQLSIECSIQ